MTKKMKFPTVTERLFQSRMPEKAVTPESKTRKKNKMKKPLIRGQRPITVMFPTASPGPMDDTEENKELLGVGRAVNKLGGMIEKKESFE